jgi:Mg-chelatase subunit ChlD
MNTNLTEIAIVLDRSGSMASMSKEAIGGMNSFLESQQKLPGEARLTLVFFDHEYIVVQNGRPIKEVPPLDETTYVPRGTTALLDAIGRTINTIGERLARTPECDRPAKVLIVILTDGLENASQEFKRDQILSMIKRQREVYSWEFIFLGANQDAIQVGSAIGIAPRHAVTFNDTPEGVSKAFSVIARASVAYRTGDADYAEHLKKAAKKDKT